jgi:hypothetical protein
MAKQVIILNDELNKFFNDNFPLKLTKFKNEDEIFDFFIDLENKLTIELMKINSNNKNIPFKIKNLSQYLLEEKLTISFCDIKIGYKINAKFYSLYNKIIEKEIEKISFNKIINETNENEISNFLSSEINELNKKFYNYLSNDFKQRNFFPNFLKSKYNKLIEDRFLTLASSKGINILSKVFDTYKNETLKLFNKIFIKNEENMFFSKSKSDSYKSYIDLIMLCNRQYFTDQNVLEVFFKYFNYLYYIFNLDTLNENKDYNEIYQVNLVLNKLIKENIEISEEESIKKLDSILNEIGTNENKILSIILCLTLIFNGIIIKDKKTKNIYFISDTTKIITSAKMKVILNNSILPFEKYLDVNEISDFCQSMLIYTILPEKENVSYNIREIKKLLTNIDNTENKDKLIKKSTIKESIIETNKSEISILSKKMFDPLLVNQQNKLMNFIENITNISKDKNITSINLESLNPKIKSTHCIIFVSGFLSDNDDHIEEWENFALNINKTNICYYYNWPSESINSVTQNSIFKVANFFLKNLTVSQNEEQNVEFKPEEIFVNSSKKAKLCGKILALIIASKIFFEYQTISLIGFSLGTHVISNCIKMLYKINDKIKCDDIIKDVILIAGATSMEHKEEHYAKMFDKIINGKIINCWSNEDQILKELYTFAMKRNPIGYGGKLNLKLDKFKSIDFTPLKLGHTDYRKKMDLVMNKIQLIT